MSPSSLQLFYQFLVFSLIITLSAARPQGAIDNQVSIFVSMIRLRQRKQLRFQEKKKEEPPIK